MPIEIRELVIKGNVGSPGKGDAKGPEKMDAKDPAASPQPLSHGEKRDIIMECVHEVMERLSQSRNL
jgi:hypothetical protein